MMEVMFKSETITEKRDNLNGAFWQMNFIDKVENLKYVEMCDGDQIKGPQEEGIEHETSLVPTAIVKLLVMGI